MRRNSYKIVSEYLNEKGAPSHIWSNLEKIYEPNGTYLKQRDLIDKQAMEIQKLNTRLNEISTDVSYMLYYMKSSGYQNMDRHLPEYHMYLEAKEIVKREKERTQ